MTNPLQVPDEYRIYCVVATTVQAPLELQSVATVEGRFRLKRLTVTQTITQPPGRIAAQVGHAVGRMRDWMLRQYLRQNTVLKGDPFFTEYCPDITTIVLAARDSFEMNHVKQLLAYGDIPFHCFLDENKEYGFGEDGKLLRVLTAIATEPVHPDSVVGMIDYLPAWDLPK